MYIVAPALLGGGDQAHRVIRRFLEGGFVQPPLPWACMASTIQRGRDQLPMLVTANAGSGGGADARCRRRSRRPVVGTASTGVGAPRWVALVAPGALHQRAVARMLKAALRLRSLMRVVLRHPAPGGRVFVHRNFGGSDLQQTRRAANGSMCLRINSSRPLPQSRSPPSAAQRQRSVSVCCLVGSIVVRPCVQKW